VFGFEALFSARIEIRKGGSNEKDKYMEARPGGPMFFRRLITLLIRYISRDMLLIRTVIIHPKSSSANAMIISRQCLNLFIRLNIIKKQSKLRVLF